MHAQPPPRIAPCHLPQRGPWVMLGWVLALLLVVPPLHAQRRAGQTTTQRGAPDWVNQTPTGRLFYYGVGRATKADYPNPADAQAAALNDALGNMARSIVVALRTENTLDRQATEELGDAFSANITDYYRNQVQAYTQNKLEGFDVTERWEGPDAHWALVRLDKDEYLSRKRAEFRQAMQTADDLYARAQTRQQDGRLADALADATQALDPILPYLDVAMEAEFRGPALDRYNDRLSLLRQLMASVRLVGPDTQIVYQPDQKQDLLVPIRAQYVGPDGQATPQPVAKLPLALHIVEGQGEVLNPVLPTDADGQAVFTLHDPRPSGTALTVLAVLDSTQYPVLDPMRPFYLMGDRLGVPRLRLRLGVQGPRVRLVAKERRFGQPVSQASTVARRMKDYLADHGVQIATRGDESRYEIRLDVEAREGGNAGGYYMARVDVHVVLIDLQSGNEVMNESVMGIKGRHFSYDEASRRGLDAAGEALTDNVFPLVLKAVYQP